MNTERKIAYRQVGDYQIPNLTLSPEETKPKIKWNGSAG